MYSPLGAPIPAAFKRMAELRPVHLDVMNTILKFDGVHPRLCCLPVRQVTKGAQH
jgi:hypothetical protein